MTTKVKLKEAFEVESKYGAFYTGGNVEWHGDRLYCQTTASISVFDINTGKVIGTIGEEASDDADTIQTFTADGSKTVTSHKSGLLKLWNSSYELEKIWKYIHNGPIARLTLKGDILCSGGSDSSVRLWNLEHQACTLNLKACQGVVSVVEFHPAEDQVFASGDDGKIYSYRLDNGQVLTTYSAHFSKVTAVKFHHDLMHFISAGRDKVIILWNTSTPAPLKTIPTYEGIESILILPHKFKLPEFKGSGGIFVASGGDNACVRVWDAQAAKEVYVQSYSLVSKAREEGGLAITKLLFDEDAKTIAVVSAEQNIILYRLKSFVVLKQFVGFADEILDVIFFGIDDSHLAVATNSNDIKVYENTTMNCQVLKGHTGNVLSLSKAAFNPFLLLSSSSDNTIRLWLMKSGSIDCIGIGMRHASGVGSVSFAYNTKFAVSVSRDACLKLWDIPDDGDKDQQLVCKVTEVAHQRDINCVTVSPNDKIIGTASQDKTAKLWTDNLTLLGVLKGHRRGVWCVRFSPVDQVVLTSSADCTIKLWSIAELNCLKTIEGHESSVVRAEFITSGMQILSAGSDGLIKMFSVKNSECLTTLEEHQARVWTLAIKKDESAFITAGSDSTIIKWRDVTESKQLERLKEMEEQAVQEQKLSNYIHQDNLLKALKLALNLGKPNLVLKVIQGVIKKGDTGLADTVGSLRNDQKEALLKCACDWNTNSRNCQPANLVLNILIHELQSGEFRPVGLASVIEGALPYTERHFKRVTQMMQDLHFINYTINCMQPHAKVNN